MEFYGSQDLPRSILLLKIHQTHIAQHHRSIFALLYVKCLWFKHIGLWIHTLLDSNILIFPPLQEPWVLLF